VRVATQFAPAHCPPVAAAQLQPIPYACGAQSVSLPIAVGTVNIIELTNINDVCESVTILPHPCKLTVDLLSLKVVSESRVTCAICVPILVFLGLCFLELLPMYSQTDVRQKHR